MAQTNLVVGASGFIGYLLWQKLGLEQCAGTYFSHPVEQLLPLDLRDAAQTLRLVEELAPAVIYQPAAQPNVEWCQQNREACRAMNVDGTANLVTAAKKVGARFVYFSTDYVFDGVDGPYAEDAPPNPISVYGEAKLAAEQLIARELEDYLIIRVTVVYGWERQGKNFIIGLINRLSRGETMNVPVDQVGSPTYADNMLDVVLELVAQERRGIYHVVGSEVMDRYAFARIAAEVFELNPDLLIPLTTAQLGQKAPRPLQAGMLVDKAQAVVSTRLVGPREGLSIMKAMGNPFA
jgi:dTDP-4-dehydrorhamnose reductase